MPDVVEIYMCKPGQKLEEGAMVTSRDIYDKESAQEDAERRCKVNSSLERIAYYAINENGDFRPYYSYTNPNVKPLAAKKTAGVDGGPRKKRRKKKQKPKTAWHKFKHWLEI